MTSEIVTVSADEIRNNSRSRCGEWQKFLKYVEKRARACALQEIPGTKGGYLVLLFESAELDLLLDLENGEIYEIVDGRYKWFLMNHHRVHPDMKPLLAPATDSRVYAFASCTRRLDPKFVRDLFNKNAETAFVEKDEDGVVRHYYFDLTKRRDNPELVLGVMVVCGDVKQKISTQR